MKTIPFLLCWCLLPAAGFAQGTLYFSNYAPAVGLNAPVFDTDGTTGLQGYWFQAQLYAGPAPGSLSPVGPPASFTGPQPGYWSGSSGSLDRLVPDVAAGAAAYVQVRVWSFLTGSSYDQVAAEGGKHGASEIFSVTTGGETLGGTQPPSFPTYLVGLKSFAVTGADPIIPEPGVIWLLALAGGVCLFARRGVVPQRW